LELNKERPISRYHPEDLIKTIDGKDKTRQAKQKLLSAKQTRNRYPSTYALSGVTNVKATAWKI
jgi:hypothetical protein